MRQRMRQIGIVSAVLMLVSAGSAMAQPITEPQTFSILSNAQRQPGTYTTASALVPEGVGGVYIVDNVTDAEASDTANSYTLTVEMSADGGLNWSPIRLYYWQGGTHVDKHTGLTVANHFNVGFGPETPNAWQGMRVRAVLDLPIRMKTGFNVTVYPVEPLP